MQLSTKGVVIGAVATVVVAGAAYGSYALTQRGAAGHTASAPKVYPPPTSAEVRTAADAFLSAWSSGDVQRAAGLTNGATQAAGQLTAFRTTFHATSLTLTPKPARGARVPFTVRAQFRYDGQPSTWSYDSSLTVTRDGAGRAVVKWAPSVVYPTLGAGQTLAVAATVPPPVTVADRNGNPLSGTRFPSLSGIIQQLKARYADKLHGTPGEAIVERGTDGKPGPALHELTQPRAGKPLPTTIDPRMQAEAEKEITTKGPDASLVAIQPSTGAILAVANNPASGYDKALMGTYASGSTFKVITASTLLSTTSYTPGSALACPKTITYGGRAFHNVEMMQIGGATLADDFAASCNTAFISTAGIMPDGTVEHEARNVFGIGLDWSVGVPSFDGSVPATSGSQKAMTYIGQGPVQMNPLTMASVAATARTGAFHQPYLVPRSVDGRTFAQAPGRLSPQVDSDIQSMMRLTARQGTAAPTIGGLPGDVGAKTGTAEVDGQTKPNSWFIAYRDDFAAAAVVPNTGEGYKFAGPIVTAVLRAAQ